MICNISNDHMEAFFSNEPVEGLQSFKVTLDHGLQHLLDQLKAEGIVHGIDQEKIDSIIESECYSIGKEFIAQGTPPVDEGIELKFHFEHSKVPETSFDENSDFHNLGFGVDVFQGQTLAEQTVVGPGKKGKTLFGKTIPNFKYTAKALTWNNAVSIEKAGPYTRFISKIDGVLFNNRVDGLEVFPSFNIRGDVNFRTGNLSTKHDIFIDGDVQSGFFVRSDKNITIRGHVEKNAILEAKGNITVKRGVHHNTKLIAGKNIILNFLQSSDINAGGGIIVKNHCFDSIVFCKQKFVCENQMIKGEKGTVIGGRINAIEGVELYSIGSPNAITHIVCGYDYQKKKELDELEALHKEVQIETKRLVRNLSINILGKSPLEQLQKLGKSEKIRNVKILRTISQLKNQKSNLGSQIKQLGSQKNRGHSGAYFKVLGQCFPDVRLDINGCFLDIYAREKPFSATEDGQVIVLEKLDK